MQYKYQGVEIALWIYTLQSLVNWYRNRSSKTTSSYILPYTNGRQLNSTVSNHANNRKFGRMLRRFWHQLFHMRYDHEGVEISISILEFQTYSIASGIDLRKTHYRSCCGLNRSDDWNQAYQIMLTIRNLDECCDDFGSIYFICNMSMKESR